MITLPIINSFIIRKQRMRLLNITLVLKWERRKQLQQQKVYLKPIPLATAYVLLSRRFYKRDNLAFVGQFYLQRIPFPRFDGHHGSVNLLIVPRTRNGLSCANAVAGANRTAHVAPIIVSAFTRFLLF